ncbi:MAG: GPGG-motif small membrane protein [Actinomycetota bacterium]
MGMLLWIAAVVLAIMGIVQIISGSFLWGIILLIVAAGIGPGGWSFYRGRSTV